MKKHKIIYPELKAAIARNGIKHGEIANLLEKTETTISSKMNGKSSFSVEEAIKVWKAYFSDIPFDILFNGKEV